MDDRLKNLRKSMEKTVFNQLEFTGQHRKKVREKIYKQYESEEDIFFAVLQLLVSEKTGYELVQSIRGRGIQTFEDNEGFVYTVLHRLEQTGCLQSRWDEHEAKYYQLNNKGRRILQKEEKRLTKNRFILNELFEG
ncbi:PadR family transcriptional regulator [Heyndrickxia sp. NPDC080065]|uniref:PadR family transcriptional regulator n=1 Tax=Heyndrickxia sp. NPDC080065 TaxID=3390568 RepID=UPI003D04E306